MLVIICGSRDLGSTRHEREWIETGLQPLVELSRVTGVRNFTVIEGGASGVDAVAAAWADQHGFAHETYKANWDRWGKAAGPVRNSRMLSRQPDLVLAFARRLSESKGTLDMVTRARQAQVPTIVFEADPPPEKPVKKQLSIFDI